MLTCASANLSGSVHDARVPRRRKSLNRRVGQGWQPFPQAPHGFPTLEFFCHFGTSSCFFELSLKAPNNLPFLYLVSSKNNILLPLETFILTL
jgi:hypothetical protein